MNQKVLQAVQTSFGWKESVDGSVALAMLGAGGECDTNTINEPIIDFIFSNTDLMYKLRKTLNKSLEWGFSNKASFRFGRLQRRQSRPTDLFSVSLETPAPARATGAAAPVARVRKSPATYRRRCGRPRP